MANLRDQARKLLGSKGYAAAKWLAMRPRGLAVNTCRVIGARLRLTGQSHRQRVFLLDLPKHNNIGDAALRVSEEYFVKEKYPNAVFFFAPVITLYLSGMTGARQWSKLARPCDVLLLQGGGNMGNLYPDCDGARRELITAFAGRPIISFPLSETMRPGDDHAYRIEAAPIYDRSQSFTLFVRDPISLSNMKARYPHLSMYLVNDIAFSLTSHCATSAGQRNGIYLCLRNDWEQHYTRAQTDALRTALITAGCTVTQGDTQYGGKITSKNRERVVFDTIASHEKYRVVVTDRLHGMVFSIISRTPCVLLQTHDHKLRGAYETVKTWPYVRFAADLDEALQTAIEFADIDHSTIAPFVPYYAPLLELVEETKVMFERAQR